MWKTKGALRILGIVFLSLLFSVPAFPQDFQKVSLAEEYLNRGEVEKALDLYEKLAKQNENLPLIHKNYFDLLLSTKDFKGAEKYLSRAVKKNPDVFVYQVDQGRLLAASDQNDLKDKFYEELIEAQGKDLNKIRGLAQEFYRAQEFDWAVATFKFGRKVSKNDGMFAHELANIYRLTNQKDPMVDEYVQMAVRNPKNRSYVKNVLQSTLGEPEDLESFEAYLIDHIQKDGKEEFYAELLIWTNLQQRNFYGAFIQARSLDKRKKSNGDQLMEVARMALQHKDYDNSIMVYDYVIQNYLESPNYYLARNAIINAREEQVKNTFPVDMEDIDELISSYQQLIEEVPPSIATFEARKNKAMLHALYKEDYDTAIKLLEEVTQGGRIPKNLKLECKISLGDIFLLKSQPWESRLLYAQVEKEGKETPIGYEAKLRSAKLSYYTGDFELAAGHLDVLKQATTREIANDAMSMSLLIKDNTALDTLRAPMEEYAAIDLLLFQKKNEEALSRLKKMLKDYPGHGLTDEIYYLMSKVYKEQGNFEAALESLKMVVQSGPEDILADDAAFEIADLYEHQIKDAQAAMDAYQSFLSDYPGSIHVEEARKRFRALRGDFPN
ncbi:tetratricopeptide repeat protein [Persicobacter sp. CCB-QB2]|uniref:tetratricopeptide repeat protein n=1 Tax=Persicobacter sp. CCB-QB2 TaxID=1561025 RepID=UPI0006A9AB9E|nr:tetratricopeptide repeat protein [Persicobacter sp. CCB-QB2]